MSTVQQRRKANSGHTLVHAHCAMASVEPTFFNTRFKATGSLASRSTVEIDVKGFLACATGDDGRWHTAFLPVFRISKRLAQAVLNGFHKNLTGLESICFLRAVGHARTHTDILLPNRSPRSLYPHYMHADTRL